MVLRASVARRVRWVLRVPTRWCPVLLGLRARTVLRVVTGWMARSVLLGLLVLTVLRALRVLLALTVRPVPQVQMVHVVLLALRSRGCSSKARRTRTHPTCRTPA